MEHQAHHLRLSLPEATAPEIAVAVAALTEGRRRTKKLVGDLTPSVLDWRGSLETVHARHSIGTLLYHIAATELEWYGDLLDARELPSAAAALMSYGVRDEGGALVPVVGEPVTAHFIRLDAARVHLLALVNAMSLAEFRRPRQGQSYSVTPEWVIHHLTQHEAEHRGQIAQLKQAAT